MVEHTGRGAGGPQDWEADHWAALQELYHRAAALPPGERTRMLRAATGDEELMRRVLDLLATEAQPAALPVSPSGREHGQLGPYSLLSLLGTGGLGTVYLAERVLGSVVQTCAVKVLSLHANDATMQARFLREQQIIANLEHPHIARMLDAGVSDTGEPFLAMELVDGVSISEHCDSNRLSLTARINLLLEVCSAVSYAHRMLVVHLDLKPSNILVAKETGSAKLLDFGTARLLSADARSATIPLATPAYASPEQLRNEPTSTACDVYSLGVVLFELLTGRRPYEGCSPAMLLDHAFRGDEPPGLQSVQTDDQTSEARSTTPAKLAKALRGELATVVAHCLRPAAADRYDSVDALAADLRRYLQGRPVLARKQTVRYRVRKFVLRHKAPVLGATLALASIAVSLSYAVVRQQQALRNAQRAVQMQAFMSQLFKLANPEHTGKPAATVPQFLHLGAAVLPQLVTDPADRRAAELSLAQSMYDAGEEQDADKLFRHVLDEARKAEDLPVAIEAKSYSGAIAYDAGDVARGEALTSEALKQAQHSRVLPSVRIRAELFYALNREEEGYRTAENLQLAEDAVTESRSAHLPPHELAYALTSLAGLLGPRGQLQRQEQLTNEALTIYNSEPWAVCDQAQANSGLALIDNQRRAFDASLEHAREAYRDQVQCSGQGSRRALERQGYVAAALISNGRAAEAIPLLEADLPQWVALVGADSDQLSTPLLFLTRAYNSTGQFAKAERTAANLVRVEQSRINPLSAQMGICQLVWAQALAGQQKRAEALVHATLADRAFQTEASKAPGTIHNAKTAADLKASLQSGPPALPAHDDADRTDRK